jgi:anti-sigma factor RsiW
MRCPIETPEGAELLLAFSFRKLDAERADVLESHVRQCARCGEFFGAQRSVDEALDLWVAPPVSADFDRRLYRRIEQEAGWWESLVRPFRLVFAARFVPIATAAVLLVAAGVWIERPGTVPAPPPRSAQVEALPPEQAEPALQEMQIIQEFSNLVHADSANPRM